MAYICLQSSVSTDDSFKKITDNRTVDHANIHGIKYLLLIKLTLEKEYTSCSKEDIKDKKQEHLVLYNKIIQKNKRRDIGTGCPWSSVWQLLLHLSRTPEWPWMAKSILWAALGILSHLLCYIHAQNLHL